MQVERKRTGSLVDAGGEESGLIGVGAPRHLGGSYLRRAVMRPGFMFMMQRYAQLSLLSLFTNLVRYRYYPRVILSLFG